MTIFGIKLVQIRAKVLYHTNLPYRTEHHDSATFLCKSISLHTTPRQERDEEVLRQMRGVAQKMPSEKKEEQQQFATMQQFCNKYRYPCPYSSCKDTLFTVVFQLKGQCQKIVTTSIFWLKRPHMDRLKQFRRYSITTLENRVSS